MGPPSLMSLPMFILPPHRGGSSAPRSPPSRRVVEAMNSSSRYNTIKSSFSTNQDLEYGPIRLKRHREFDEHRQGPYYAKRSRASPNFGNHSNPSRRLHRKDSSDLPTNYQEISYDPNCEPWPDRRVQRRTRLDDVDHTSSTNQRKYICQLCGLETYLLASHLTKDHDFTKEQSTFQESKQKSVLICRSRHDGVHMPLPCEECNYWYCRLDIHLISDHGKDAAYWKPLLEKLKLAYWGGEEMPSRLISFEPFDSTNDDLENISNADNEFEVLDEFNAESPVLEYTIPFGKGTDIPVGAVTLNDASPIGIGALAKDITIGIQSTKSDTNEASNTPEANPIRKEKDACELEVGDLRNLIKRIQRFESPSKSADKSDSDNPNFDKAEGPKGENNSSKKNRCLDSIKTEESSPISSKQNGKVGISTEIGMKKTIGQKGQNMSGGNNILMNDDLPIETIVDLNGTDEIVMTNYLPLKKKKRNQDRSKGSGKNDLQKRKDCPTIERLKPSSTLSFKSRENHSTKETSNKPTDTARSTHTFSKVNKNKSDSPGKDRSNNTGRSQSHLTNFSDSKDHQDTVLNGVTNFQITEMEMSSDIEPFYQSESPLPFTSFESVENIANVICSPSGHLPKQPLLTGNSISNNVLDIPNQIEKPMTIFPRSCSLKSKKVAKRESPSNLESKIVSTSKPTFTSRPLSDITMDAIPKYDGKSTSSLPSTSMVKADSAVHNAKPHQITKETFSSNNKGSISATQNQTESDSPESYQVTLDESTGSSPDAATTKTSVLTSGQPSQESPLKNFTCTGKTCDKLASDNPNFKTPVKNSASTVGPGIDKTLSPMTQRILTKLDRKKRLETEEKIQRQCLRHDLREFKQDAEYVSTITKLFIQKAPHLKVELVPLCKEILSELAQEIQQKHS
ncbi:serine-rich adhesin for platelets-like [Clytia hemisphaerica]|uniref:Uncharacterized protein n=1 Tax=Clytia hemisphaerica TaxID=252671 RepID=A0A7M5UQV4_9CNID